MFSIFVHSSTSLNSRFASLVFISGSVASLPSMVLSFLLHTSFQLLKIVNHFLWFDSERFQHHFHTVQINTPSGCASEMKANPLPSRWPPVPAERNGDNLLTKSALADWHARPELPQFALKNLETFSTPVCFFTLIYPETKCSIVSASTVLHRYAASPKLASGSTLRAVHPIRDTPAAQPFPLAIIFA
jgi:hypothetical protein